MSPTIVRNQKSKLEEGDKFHLGHHEFGVTGIRHHIVKEMSGVKKRYLDSDMNLI